MAQKTQGTAVAVGTATASTKNITGITQASPPVVSIATHGYTAGQLVYIDGIVGMTQLNKRVFVVANPTSGTFELKGVDATAYTAYGSGGTAALKTMTAIGEVASIGPGFDGEASEIPVTHLLSTAVEIMLGLQDYGQAGMTVFLTNPVDTGQARLRALKRQAAAEAFSITLPSGQVASFMAFVKSFPFAAITPDAALQGSPNLRVTGEPGCEFA